MCIIWTLIKPDKDATWETLRASLDANVEVLDNVKVCLAINLAGLDVTSTCHKQRLLNPARDSAAHSSYIQHPTEWAIPAARTVQCPDRRR